MKNISYILLVIGSIVLAARNSNSVLSMQNGLPRTRLSQGERVPFSTRSLLNAVDYQVRSPGPGGPTFVGGLVPALVSHTAIAGNNTGTISTAAIDTTGSTVLVAVGAGYPTASISLTDSKANAWTQLNTQPNHDNVTVALWYCLAPRAGTGHTFTLAGASYPSITVMAFSGVTALDQSNHTYLGPANTNTMQPGSITPTSNGQLIVVGAATAIGPVSAIDSGFTLADHAEQVTATMGAYRIQSSAGAVNPTFQTVYQGAYQSGGWNLSLK